MRTRHRLTDTLGPLALLGLLAACLPVSAQLSYEVTLNTSGLNGTAGTLAFDLIDGDGIVNNTAVISLFSTDGTLALGGNTNTGGASGDLPGNVTIADTAFFNESLRGLTLGNSISFRLTLTDTFVGPTPDSFSFFLLDSTATNSLVTTDDPSGANALFAVDLNGPGGVPLTVFNSSTPGVSVTVASAVPEPGELTILLTGVGLALPLLRRRAR